LVIQHVDTVVAALIRSAVPTGVDVRTDPPGTPTPGPAGDVVSVFLHRVEEDVAARAASWTDELDECGRVVARRLPARRYRFCYLVTASGADRGSEHARLGEVLVALAGWFQVPVEYVPPALRTGPPIDLDVAHPGLPGVSADLWTSFGVAPSTCLDVVLSVTLTPQAVAPLPAPPAEVVLGVAGEPPARVPPALADPPRRRIRE
jgi:hypothetical protein